MAGETRKLAGYVHECHWSDLPERVRHEGRRAFLNWVGCAIGGSDHPAVDALLASVREFSGRPQATALALDERFDMCHASLVNGLSASAYCYDDTELDTILHPTAASAAALLALAECRRVSGNAFVHALILSNEVQCRLARALMLPPAHCHLGIYMTGLVGAPGVALAAGKLLGLSQQQLIWALGTGACQGAGFRATHASMCCGLVPALAGRNGLAAAWMASGGITCTDTSLESPNGFLNVHASPPAVERLTDNLGVEYAALSVAAKPYPCGCLIHPAIDGCLELINGEWKDADEIQRVELSVHPLALGLTGTGQPATGYDAQVSVYHWVAATLVQRSAGLQQAGDECVGDPAVIRLRSRIDATANDAFDTDEAKVVLVMKNGRRLESHVRHCLGSRARPMTDAELEKKFLDQVVGHIPEARAKALIDQCWNITDSADVSRLAPGIWGGS